MNVSQLHQHFLRSSGVTTDSRKIEESCIFFALKGPHFNGNRFASEALEKGASLAIVDEREYAVSDNIIPVADSLLCLQDLARYHRRQYQARIIGLTGSNGKTTTKELLHAVLSRKFNTLATRGNLNNHIGVPLTLLGIQKDTDLAVVEMGANHRGEIQNLCGIAEPDFGLITNFGKAHLEGFGGVEGVILGKSELYDHLMARGGHIFINGDDPLQREKTNGYKNVSGYSASGGEFLKIQLLEAEPFVRLAYRETILKTQLVGSYNFNNCAAAVLAGDYFGVSPEDIKSGLEGYVPSNNRSQLLEKGGYLILLDAYNANPSSMRVALETFSRMPGGPKTVILGDMFELGDSAAREHGEIAALAGEKGFDRVYLVGENFSRIDSDLQSFSSFDAFSTFLKTNPPAPGSLMLIKGSRGMALERVLEGL